VNLPVRVARPPEKPLLIFDGDCTFCRCWIARWQQTVDDRVDCAPLQSPDVADQFPELSRAQLEEAVHFIQPDGRVYRGAEAAFRSLAPAVRWPLRIYESVPGAAPIADVSYRFIAKHRSLFSWMTRLLWGTQIERPASILVRWLFLRSLGLVYLIAFLSLGSQISGLAGRNGIMPASQIMTSLQENLPDAGWNRFRLEPTLCWWNADDSFLLFHCRAGAVLSGLLILGLAPGPILVLLWVLYLSLATVCPLFLGYQWDNLLLEAGLLAVFVAPWRIWPSLHREMEPSRLAWWLLRWLLFRLMFASGCVKLMSHDAAWRNLTALTVHYETQPLATWLAWYAHQLPVWAHKLSCAAMFGIELIIPFLIFLPRRPRFVAFWLFIALQTTIALTGNYTFFNLLAVVLCIPLLDDLAIRHFFPQRRQERAEVALARRRSKQTQLLLGARRTVVGFFAIVVIVISSLQLLFVFGVRPTSESLPVAIYRWWAPLRSINSYGLFAVMTMTRPEIIVEGSDDGHSWKAYEFKHKPGEIHRRPDFVAPHQPRLDWQMWFAALGDIHGNPWLVNYCGRLLQGQSDVLSLMGQNPFPQKPPRFVRAVLYQYHFSNFAERRRTGAWWSREYQGVYCPPLSLQNAGPK
jgi:predicted DCC family thiol-disulfide oxidoreductase YuxK